MDVTVCVGTFGEESWAELAQHRAVPSARQLGVPVVHVHADTLHDARNTALGDVETEYVCFLDADDELEPGYFDHLARSTADVRVPSVRYVTSGVIPRERMPRVAGHVHDCTAECLADGNWIVIGAAVKADLVREVGGFLDFSWSEDWSLWVRCWQAGATFDRCLSAVYRAYVRPDSRNRGPDRATKHAAHQAIARAHGLPVPA